LTTVLLPFALARAVEETSLRYEAIIVDEAQDFAADFWLGIDMLLADRASSYFYVFFDHNQVLYERAAKPPIEDAPFLLTVNCRNTRPIHDAAYRFYSGETTDAPSIEGAPIERLVAGSVEAQANRIAKEVIKLIDEERVAPKEIAVLVASDQKKPIYEALKAKPPPKPASFSFEVHRLEDTVLVDTVARFKGLEAAIIFLCGLESVCAERDRELIYVGLSRAKSRIYLVGSDQAMALLLGNHTV
jgi:superfamily I DNA and RNA helicase